MTSPDSRCCRVNCPSSAPASRLAMPTATATSICSSGARPGRHQRYSSMTGRATMPNRHNRLWGALGNMPRPRTLHGSMLTVMAISISTSSLAVSSMRRATSSTATGSTSTMRVCWRKLQMVPSRICVIAGAASRSPTSTVTEILTCSSARDPWLVNTRSARRAGYCAMMAA